MLYERQFLLIVYMYHDRIFQSMPLMAPSLSHDAPLFSALFVDSLITFQLAIQCDDFNLVALPFSLLLSKVITYTTSNVYTISEKYHKNASQRHQSDNSDERPSRHISVKPTWENCERY